jgi:hypothetical protein
MRLVRLLSATLLALAGLVAVGATTESAQAAGSKDLSIPYDGKVIKNESIYAEGQLPTSDDRPVKLQYRSSSKGAWKTYKADSSYLGGYFEFQLNTSKTRYWRYYAPKSGALAKIVGNSRKVTVVSQKVQSITVHNARQCRSTPQPITVVVDFYPSRNGRYVTFTYNGDQTQNSEDFDGVSAFTFTPPNDGAGGSFSIKATADALYGAAAISSQTVKYVRSDSYCLF